MMSRPDREFPVKMMSDQNNVGILASVGHWLFDLQRKKNCEMKKKRKIEMKIKNV